MSDPLTIAISKNGENPIQISLDRSYIGLTVEVKTTRSVEEFMKSLGGGAHLPVETMGRYWQHPVVGQKLLAYELTANVDVSRVFELGCVGHPLLHHDTGQVNLSFLRLIGVSEGVGVKFGVKGVFSWDSVHELRDMLGKAVKQFYIDYMKPMHLTVMISTQDLR
jgi:hypothetical protein